MNKHEKLLFWLTAASVAALIFSNLLAVKLFNCAGIAMDCGILLYPVTYIIGDLIVEFYGKDKANLILLVSFVMNLLGTLLLFFAVQLPDYSGWDGQDAYAYVFGFMPRIVAGSLTAYLIAGRLNNRIFEKIRARSLAVRMLGSSAVARVADSLIFETIAFAGVLPFGDFLAQAGLAYAAGMALEVILFLFITRPVTRLTGRWLDRA